MARQFEHKTGFRLLPGLLICFAVMMAGIYGADLIGFLLTATGVLPEGSSSPISGIFRRYPAWNYHPKHYRASRSVF